MRNNHESTTTTKTATTSKTTKKRMWLWRRQKMNYKTKMMIQHKKLYGGDYYKDNGRWYWKKNPEDTGTLVTSGWVINRVNNYKPEQPVPQPIKEPEPTQIPKPQQPKKSKPKATNKPVEEVKNQDESV
jgi:hypothetical protein